MFEFKPTRPMRFLRLPHSFSGAGFAQGAGFSVMEQNWGEEPTQRSFLWLM
jgi:hypothetical protein